MIVDINSNINKELLIYLLKNLINGTPPELISTDIEEEIFFPITIDDNDILYHGTSKISGEIIRESGFLCTPRITEMESTHGGDESFQDTIYVTNNIDIAKAWAEDRAKVDKSSPVIIKIKGKNINDAGCKAFVDALYFTVPVSSIVLKGCYCIKIDG